MEDMQFWGWRWLAVDDGQDMDWPRRPLFSAEDARADLVACLRTRTGINRRISEVADLIEGSTPPTAAAWYGFVFLIARLDRDFRPVIDRDYGRKYNAAFAYACKFRNRPRIW
jgi:hypothetical protein